MNSRHTALSYKNSCHTTLSYMNSWHTTLSYMNSRHTASYMNSCHTTLSYMNSRHTFFCMKSRHTTSSYMNSHHALSYMNSCHTTLSYMNCRHIRRVWRYQRGNQNPYIEEQQTTQWPKEKVQKDKQRSTKPIYKTKNLLTRTPLKTARVSSSCLTSDTGRVNLVTNQSWMRKGPGRVYDKWNISLCLCYTDIP